MLGEHSVTEPHSQPQAIALLRFHLLPKDRTQQLLKYLVEPDKQKANP